ncbi:MULTISPECIES: NmrA family NAD(P)-binding protein [Niastella]|uniref:NmrA family NAD(P)-binding protein n=1 Tax=Niastella soli TaxID=2821487 RepID=A0ABS3YMH0_9BACT|nr:NmrA family NAD(P)-binding protein [Niastella soli]MBO9198640.1 NmrA family NAD(P)-binding protein [Niastella soli]
MTATSKDWKQPGYKIFTIFGAKGKVGIELLKILSAKSIYCRAITRDLNNIPKLPNVTWMGGDLNDLDSVYNLVAGSDTIFLNTDFAPNMVQMQGQVIEAAKHAGVKHVIRLSYGLLPEEILKKSNSPVHMQHILIDQALIDSGLSWTILRPSGFMQNWLYDQALTIKNERKIYEAQGDGRLPYIDTRDIAEIIAALFAQGEKHYNKIHELTGSEAINFYEVATAISQAIGEKVTYIAETREATIQRFSKKGYPEWAIELLLFFAQSQQQGKLTATTDTVKEILEKPARDIYTFTRDHAEWFK